MAENGYASLMDPASERAKRGAFFFLVLFASIVFAMWDLARFLWGGDRGPEHAKLWSGCWTHRSDVDQLGAGLWRAEKA